MVQASNRRSGRRVEAGQSVLGPVFHRGGRRLARAAANPAIALRFQSSPLVGGVAELESFDGSHPDVARLPTRPARHAVPAGHDPDRLVVGGHAREPPNEAM